MDRRPSALAPLLLAFALLGSCKKAPSLDQRMQGPWRASIAVGASASKDPIVRTFGKVFERERGKLLIDLNVSERNIEVRRYSQVEGRDVTQQATYTVLDGERIELSTNGGKTVVRVTPNGCQEPGSNCLGIEFAPLDVASPVVTEMGYLFGCEDTSGKIDCATLSTLRMFFRYAPDTG